MPTTLSADHRLPESPHRLPYLNLFEDEGTEEWNSDDSK